MVFPKTRDMCEKGLRPCPWIRCKQHMLWAMIPKTGYQQKNQDGLIAEWIESKTDEEILELIFSLKETCVLDVVGNDCTLQDIGDILNITRERVRQIEECKKGGAVVRLRHHSRSKQLRDFKE